MILDKTNPAINGLEETIKLLEVHITSGEVLDCDKLATIKATLLDVKTDYIASNKAYVEANESLVSIETLIELLAKIIQSSIENSENMSKYLTALNPLVNSIIG